MTMLPFLEDLPTQPIIEESEPVKTKAPSPFDYVNAIHHTKEDMMATEGGEKGYNPFIVNKALSFGVDTILFANEMNARYHLPKKMQFDFLINTVRPRKRYNKWLKAEKVENVELVKAYYGFNTQKALAALRILTPQQIEFIKAKMDRGGNGKAK